MNLLGIDVGISAENKSERSFEVAIKEHSIDAVFTNVLEAITKQELAPDGVLVVIDEFDQIADPRGFASLLKSIATNVPRLKICIVGVA